MPSLTARVLFPAIALALMVPSSLSAQTTTKKSPPPKPRPVQLQTKDGVELSGFYFGSNRGKAAIPVLLIHGWAGQKSPYGSLCQALVKQGCAVLALDYRGHGGSREYVDRFGKTKTFDLKTMNKNDVAAIVNADIEAAKKFLKEENNEGNLNLNALVVIGVREGCVIAANWSQKDWSYPSVGSKKQGQDVKALVLISPKRLLKGVKIETALKSLAALPMLFVVGNGSDEQSDTDRIYRQIEVQKKKISPDKSADDLEMLRVKQALGGPDLVRAAPQVIPGIGKFITSSVEISDIDNPWIERQ